MKSKVRKDKPKEHICPRCGELRHNGGFRFFRHGIGYCDKCAFLAPTWIAGPGYFYSTTVVEGF